MSILRLIGLCGYLLFWHSKKGFTRIKLGRGHCSNVNKKKLNKFHNFLFLFLCCTFLARLLDRDFDWEGQEYGLFLVAFCDQTLPSKSQRKKERI
jgi:hypothetical protein